MILLTALGAAAESYLGWKPGLVVGLVAGLLLARFVPVPGGGCAVPPRSAEPPTSEAPPGADDPAA
ncbi:MAG: hypothetical protein P1V36_13470 [Planctomycetota bacterium]|nr:hypothetical protein [Planctomycetota bacterium]